MTNIILMCSAGMSTSMLVQRMEKAAKELNYNCTISAHAVGDVLNLKDQADIILLGPQVRFQLPKIKEMCPNIPVECVDTMAYGTMDGMKVIKTVQELLEGKQG